MYIFLENAAKHWKKIYKYWLKHSLKENCIHDQASDMKGFLYFENKNKYWVSLD